MTDGGLDLGVGVLEEALSLRSDMGELRPGDWLERYETRVVALHYGRNRNSRLDGSHQAIDKVLLHGLTSVFLRARVGEVVGSKEGKTAKDGEH